MPEKEAYKAKGRPGVCMCAPKRGEFLNPGNIPEFLKYFRFLLPPPYIEYLQSKYTLTHTVGPVKKIYSYILKVRTDA